MLTFGDSAMWGNGLRDEFKYAHLVAQDIADRTGRDVNLVSYAHSAATLADPGRGKYEPLIPADGNTPPGDLNAGLPTSTQQEGCAAAREDYRDAEVILLNGCINEVGAQEIALPFPLSGLTVGQIKARSHQWCSSPMLALLQNSKQDFQYATILVANYWRIISDKSSPIGIAVQRGADADATPAEREMYASMKGLLDTELEAERLTGQLVTDRRVALADPKAVFRQWGDGSAAFLETSQRCFEWAVAAVNGRTSLPNRSDDCPSVGVWPNQRVTPDVRVFLAKVVDDPDYSYGAPQKHLWSVPLGPHVRADQLYSQRLGLCRSHYHSSEIGARLICRVNPTAHPNVLGGAAYREAITKILETAWSRP